MIVAVIDSAQVSDLSSQEVWEAGLETGALLPRLAVSGCPWLLLCALDPGTGKESSPERQVGLAVPQGFPLSIFFGLFCSTGRAKGLVFALTRPSMYLTQDEMVTGFLSDRPTMHTSPRGFSFANVHSQA